MLKKTLTSFVLTALFVVGLNQSAIQVDKRVVEYLGIDKVAMLQKNNPDLILYYNYFLDHAYILSEVPQDKLDFNSLKELTLPLVNGKVNTKSLNILKLDLQRKFDQRLYFKIRGTHQLFIVLSENEFMKKYNAYKKENALID